MLNEKEQAFLDKFKPKRLTFECLDTDLFQTRWGARTIADALECQRIETEYLTNLNEQEAKVVIAPEMSEEMMRHNERFIDEHGFSMY